MGWTIGGVHAHGIKGGNGVTSSRCSKDPELRRSYAGFCLSTLLIATLM